MSSSQSSNPSIRYSAMGRRVHPPAITALMSAALETPGILSLAAGFTDSATLPITEVGAAIGALARVPGLPEHLQYGTNRGRPDLRRMLAERTSTLDGLPAGAVAADRTMIGNGSQQLLYLAMQVLTDPGDIILVERPTYFVFLEMLSGLGVEAVGLPSHPDGSLDLAACDSEIRRLAASPARERVKALYLMGYFGNPSGISRTEAEKDGLAAIFARAGWILPVLEDAAYRDLWYEQPWPARSVLALDAFRTFPRLYLGTLTKPFATGLKIGYAHASDAGLFDRMCWLKGHHDFGSANFNQAVLERVLACGDFDRHLVGLRETYAAKMRTLHDALVEGGLGEAGWTWAVPKGGLYLWLRAPEGVDCSIDGPFWRACMDERVLYVPGSLCLAAPADPRCVRLSFGVLGHEDLREAARRFDRAARRIATACSRS